MFLLVNTFLVGGIFERLTPKEVFIDFDSVRPIELSVVFRGYLVDIEWLSRGEPLFFEESLFFRINETDFVNKTTSTLYLLPPFDVYTAGDYSAAVANSSLNFYVRLPLRDGE